MRLLGRQLTIAAAVGALVILACAGGAIFAPDIAPFDPNLPMGQRWEAPSAEHWLGLDHIGRDVFSRLLFGGRVSIAVAGLASCLAIAAGASAGFAAAISRRWIGVALARIADTALAMPAIIWALIVVTALGSSLPVLVLTIGIVHAFAVMRVVRAETGRLLALGYVEAARLRGESRIWTLRHEILPSASPRLLGEFGARFSSAFLIVAALSFLGLGVQPPDADWGSMVRESALAIPAGNAAPLFPAAAIALLVIGVNLLADWLLAAGAQRYEDRA